MPRSEWAVARQKIRTYIHKKVRESGKFKSPENVRLVVREIFSNIDLRVSQENYDNQPITKEELDKEIDRVINDPIYLNLK